MAEPIDIRKYDFISMPVKERWGAWVCANSDLAQKEWIQPEDLVGKQLITATGEFLKSSIGKWLGEYHKQVKIVAMGNLPYNEAMLAESNLGIVLGIKLNYAYENLCFIPLYPLLEISTVMAWKKEQVFSPATSSFIEFINRYEKVISGDKL